MRDVRAGQVYEDVKERRNRRLEVLFVELMEKNRGRLKARYTYAQVKATSGRRSRKIWIDTDRLQSEDYRLVYDPPTASTPQSEP